MGRHWVVGATFFFLTKFRLWNIQMRRCLLELSWATNNVYANETCRPSSQQFLLKVWLPKKEAEINKQIGIKLKPFCSCLECLTVSIPGIPANKQVMLASDSWDVDCVEPLLVLLLLGKGKLFSGLSILRWTIKFMFGWRKCTCFLPWSIRASVWCKCDLPNYVVQIRFGTTNI